MVDNTTDWLNKFTLDIHTEDESTQLFFRDIVVPELEKRNIFLCIDVGYFEGTHRIRRRDEFSVQNSINRSRRYKTHLYIVVVDNDERKDFRARKEEIASKLPGVDPRLIVVVTTEIESWYLAGLDDDYLCKCNMVVAEPDMMCKEDYYAEIPVIELDDAWFKEQIRKNYHVEVALRKSPSFSSFWNTYVLGDWEGRLRLDG